MKVTLESTDKIIAIVVNGVEVPARVWEGHTENAIPCTALITRIAARADADLSEVERDLQERARPIAANTVFPLRMAL